MGLYFLLFMHIVSFIHLIPQESIFERFICITILYETHFQLNSKKKQLETFIDAMKTAIKYNVEILIRFDVCFIQKKKQTNKKT